MNKANRAAQFAPFDALRGLREALTEKEQKLAKVAKKELTDEQITELSAKLLKLKRGARVAIVYYHSGYYLTLKGRVQANNIPLKHLIINDQKIPYQDLLSLKIVVNDATQRD